MLARPLYFAGSPLPLVVALGCVDSSAPSMDEAPDMELWVKVQIDSERVLARVPPYGFGMHTSVYDNALHDRRVPEELETAGITMLRYPGGGYSDNYHWSTHSMTPWSDGNRGYLAERSDFGNYLSVASAANVALMITVNYGSNQAGDGPGEPNEAAAWVAYANGDPDDEHVIGVDGAGEDWQTVGFWASLRAADKLEQDDGLNFLRIGREEPVGIEYWEIGNEVFGNGYYASGSDVGFELDLHVPYDGRSRLGHPDLSGRSYGEGVVEYARAMKAVDPDIKIGAVLVTPPDDYAWAPEWNDQVLAECATDIDFGIVHWYPNRRDLLNAPQHVIPEMFEELRARFAEHAGGRADDLEIAVTELGPAPGAPSGHIDVSGLFAGDSYLTFLEQGASNVAWLELHNGSFLRECDGWRGRAFQGIRLAHLVADVGDELVETTSSEPAVVVAHASKRQDGNFAVMLMNSHQYRTAKVTVSGFGGSGDAQVYRYDPFAEQEPPGSLEGDACRGALENREFATQLLGPESLEIEAGEFTVELPWLTVTVVIAPER